MVRLSRGCAKLASHPLISAYLFVLTVLPLFHWAHRFRYYLMNFGITGPRRPITIACYGSAVAGALGAALTLLRGPRGGR